MDSVYALGKELDESKKRHHLCGSFDFQYDKPISPGKLAGCACITVTTSVCRAFAFVTIAGGTKYTPRSESMAMRTAKRRGFRHFRMQELDCVISKSRLGSGEREREIQLAQLRMQDFEFNGQKKFPQTKEEDPRRRRIRENLSAKLNAGVEANLTSTLVQISEKCFASYDN